MICLILIESNIANDIENEGQKKFINFILAII